MTDWPANKRSIAGYCLVIWTLSVCYAVVTPPFQVPDEVAHYWHSVSLAQGHVWQVVREGRRGSYVTRSARDLVYLTWVDTAGQPNSRVGLARLKDAAKLPFQSDPVFRPFPSLYTPLPYLPAALSCLVTDFFHVRPLFAFYAGRIVTATAAVILIGFAMAECGELVAMIAAIALLPMTLFMFGSYSADAVTIAGSFYTGALAWRVRSRVDSATGTWARLWIAAFVLAACKAVYAPVALLAILPVPLSGGPTKRVRIAFLLCSLTLGAAFSALVVSRQYSPLSASADPEAQMRLAGANPFRFIGVAAADYAAHYAEYRNELVGYLGKVDVAVSGSLIAATFYLLVAVAATSEVTLTVSSRALIMMVGVLLCFGVSLSQYIIWTAPGAAHVEGIQGRYFLPAAFVLLLPFAAIIRHKRVAVMTRALYAIAAVAINVDGLMLLGRRYY